MTDKPSSSLRERKKAKTRTLIKQRALRDTFTQASAEQRVFEQQRSLSPLAGSTQPVSNGGVGAAPGLAQVAFNVISSAVGTTQVAACWIVLSKNGKFAYTTNAGSGSISSYRIAADGSLALLDATAGLTGPGSSPLDMAFSNNGSYLYALAWGAHTITIFQIAADGSLSDLGAVGVPAGVVGLAAR